MPLTAIIPTTGRRSHMLKRAVASVMHQTQKVDALIIVLDDDNTQKPTIADIDHDAIVLCTGHRQGVSTARNLGANQAKPGHLAFLDDDDVWKPNYLSTVFAQGDDFDVALTAFEKHRPDDVAPEKTPPTQLTAEQFMVANPGLRGSNLIIRKSVYMALGGFDTSLPAFNDMDFGIRLANEGPWNYRRNTAHLVEFHSHRGPRLSTAGGLANRVGMGRFWKRYKARMTTLQQQQFRSRAVKIWGWDPGEVSHEG